MWIVKLVWPRRSSEQAYEQPGTPDTGIPTLPQNFALGGLRVSTIVQAGVELNLPLRNRIAQSDAARDTVQVRQAQARTEKLADQIRVDIENARMAVETSFAAYNAARTGGRTFKRCASSSTGLWATCWRRTASRSTMRCKAGSSLNARAGQTMLPFPHFLERRACQ